ncbi:MAG TPA: AraC family transcriptional regulator [Ruminiclostridium sp.]
MKNDWLHMNCPPFPAFISCGKSFFMPGDVHAERIFPTFVIMFIIHGTVYLTEGENHYDLTAGEYFIQTPGIRHYGYKPSNENAEYFWIHFIPQGNYLLYLPDSQEVNKNNVITITDTGVGIRKPEILINLKMNDSYPIEEFSNLLSELVHTFSVLQYPIKSQSIFTKLIGYMSEAKNVNCLYEKDILADHVHKYIKINYKTCINLKIISSTFNFTPDYITRCFKQRFGLTPSEYVSQLKMDFAKNMLTSTNKNIEYIANELGYTDLAVFSRMFKTFERVAPSKYRHQIWGDKL